MLLALLLGCWSTPRPVPADVAGSYKGTYAGAEDLIELRPDGQMQQRVVRQGKTYTSRGTWRISGRSVVIYRILSPLGLRGEPVEPPTRYAYLEGLWVTLNGRSRIVFDIDIEYAIDKLPSATAAPWRPRRSGDHGRVRDELESGGER